MALINITLASNLNVIDEGYFYIDCLIYSTYIKLNVITKLIRFLIHSVACNKCICVLYERSVDHKHNPNICSISIFGIFQKYKQCPAVSVISGHSLTQGSLSSSLHQMPSQPSHLYSHLFRTYDLFILIMIIYMYSVASQVAL